MQQPPKKVEQWIASVYDERDVALARNRELEEQNSKLQNDMRLFPTQRHKTSDLEEWLAAAREMINSLAKRNGELEQQVESYGDSIVALESAGVELRELVSDLLSGLQDC